MNSSKFRERIGDSFRIAQAYHLPLREINLDSSAALPFVIGVDSSQSVIITVRTSLKATVPALTCAIGLLYCVYQIHRSRFVPPPDAKVEITVYGPDGKVIPAVRKR